MLGALLTLLPWGGPQSNWSAICFALTPPAQIKIAADVQVEGDRVTLWDLCAPGVKMGAWQTVMQKVDIGAAPAVNSTKYIAADRLRPYLQRFLKDHGCDPSQVTLTLPKQVTITRKAMQLSSQQIKSIYRQYVRSNSPWDNDDLKIHRIYFPEPPRLPAGNLSYKVTTSPNESFVGNVGITINFFVDGQQERSLHVMGKVDLYRKVVETVRPLGQHDIVRASDVELVRTDVAGHPEKYATSKAQVVGQQLLRDLGPHHPILRRDLTPARVVKRGSVVTIVYQNQSLRLTASGQARQAGCIGDTIRVTNVMTKRTVLCQVVNNDTVQALQ